VYSNQWAKVVSHTQEWEIVPWKPLIGDVLNSSDKLTVSRIHSFTTHPHCFQL